jgi:ubiquinone/menaquinone biosynthesis C-methylase UbiE
MHPLGSGVTASDPRRDYQDPTVVASYEHERFRSPWGRVYAAMHRRGIRKALLHLEGQGTVLDVPCGTGRIAPLVTGLGLSYLGLDISTAMVSHCREHHGSRSGVVGLSVGDIERLPFEDASVDAVVCLKLLHLITVPNIALALRECERVAARYVIFDIARHDRWTPLVRWFAGSLVQAVLLAGEGPAVCPFAGGVDAAY